MRHTFIDKEQIKRRIFNVFVTKDMGEPQPNTPLYVLVDEIVDELSTLIEEVSQDAAQEPFYITTFRSDIELLKNKPHVDSREVADHLWERIKNMREKEQNEFIEDLKSI